jgi:hypothetical protein
VDGDADRGVGSSSSPPKCIDHLHRHVHPLHPSSCKASTVLSSIPHPPAQVCHGLGPPARPSDCDDSILYGMRACCTNFNNEDCMLSAQRAGLANWPKSTQRSFVCSTYRKRCPAIQYSIPCPDPCGYTVLPSVLLSVANACADY